MHKGQGENFLIFQKTELGKNFEVLSCFKNHVEIYKNSQLYNLYKYITYPRKPDVDKRYDLLYKRYHFALYWRVMKIEYIVFSYEMSI